MVKATGSKELTRWKEKLCYVIFINNIGLKNSLLKFGGANVDWQDEDWDERNEKKMAEKIVNLL